MSTTGIARLGLMILVWLLLGLVTAVPLFLGRRGWWSPVLQPMALWAHVYVAIFSIPFLLAKVWGTWRLLRHAPPGRQAPLVDRSASVVLAVFVLVLYGSGALLSWNAASEGNLWLKDLHLYSTFAMLAPLTWHLMRRLQQSWRTVRKVSVLARPGDRRGALYSRRELLLLALLAALGWVVQRTSSTSAGADPNDFPVTNFGQPPASIQLDSWRLRVVGGVATPLTLSYQDLIVLPRERHRYSLDCVTGWSATRDWEGVPIRKLLEMAGSQWAEPRLRFVTSSGNDVIMWPSQWGRTGALLVTHVDGVPLSHDHGFPLRLMVPGTSGEENLKWLVEIQVLGD